MELYEKNIDFFSKNHPEIYDLIQSASGESYRFVTNDSGSPDIVEVSSGHMIYGGVDLGEIIENSINSVNAMRPDISLPPEFCGNISDSYRYTSPIQSEFWDAIFTTGPLKSQDSFAVNTPGSFLPFVRIYGIGLGYHLLHIIQSRSVDYIVVYEPEVDMFVCSLHTVPWWLVFDYFAQRHGDILLAVGETSENHVRKSEAWLLNRFRFLVGSFFRLVFFNSEIIRRTIEIEKRNDGEMVLQRNLGWYEDQRGGLVHSLLNMRRGHPVYTGRRLASKVRAFVVGSGPTLNESLEFIRRHRDDAVIFSCGSALFYLLDAGITPDFQVVQERFWLDFEEKIKDTEVLKSIDLIMLNPVYDKLADYYRNTYVMLKNNEPGSLLWPEDYPLLFATHPTVTNMGVSLVGTLGVAEAWLFGCDYGRHERFSTAHADGGYYKMLNEDHQHDDVLSTELTLPGALGGVVVTDHNLAMSRRTTEGSIVTWLNTRWIRVGDGAEIAGVTALDAKDFPVELSLMAGKDLALKDIRGCYANDYVQRINLDNLPALMEKDFFAFNEVMAPLYEIRPVDKSGILRQARFMLQAADQAQNEHHMSGQLLAGSFMLFVANVFIQAMLYENDEDAILFYGRAMNLWKTYLYRMEEDSVDICRGILRGEVQGIPFASALGSFGGVGAQANPAAEGLG